MTGASASQTWMRVQGFWRQVRIITSGMGSWRYVDCVSIHGGKLEALEYVRTLFSIPRERCVAAGDSGNDILMLEGASPLRSVCRAVLGTCGSFACGGACWAQLPAHLLATEPATRHLMALPSLAPYTNTTIAGSLSCWQA